MAEEKRGTLSVLTLIFGIVGILISWVLIVNYLGLALCITAIVLGTVELTQISKGTSSASGRGLATTGMILGAIGIVIGFIFAFVLPG